jgi:hypothetical protein
MTGVVPVLLWMLAIGVSLLMLEESREVKSAWSLFALLVLVLVFVSLVGTQVGAHETEVGTCVPVES